MDFRSLFLDRNAPAFLAIDATPGPERSRVGGNAPAHFLAQEHQAFLQGHRFLMTLADEFSGFNGGLDLSIFLRKGFAAYEDDTRYPNIGIVCVSHPPCGPARDPIGRIDEIGEGRLVLMPQAADQQQVPYFVKVGGDPDWIQDEPAFERELLKDGYAFILQVDENGYPDGFLLGDYLFSYGALFVYGSWTRPGHFDRIVAGFTQFS